MSQPGESPATTEYDLFGTPIGTTEERRAEIIPELLQKLLVEQVPCMGPTHSTKLKGIVYPGKEKLWLPPRGEGRKKTMIIGFYPTDHEKQVLVGPTGVKLDSTLRSKVGILMNECYLTSLIKYHFPPGSSVSKEAVDICMPYLKKEIETFKPELLICLGSEVFAHMTGYEGGIEDYRGSKFKHPDYNAEMAVVWLPSVVLKDPDQEQIWVNDLKSVFGKLNVEASTNWEEQDALPRNYITNLDELKAAVDIEVANNTSGFAIDTEFDGETWYDAHCFKIDISTDKTTLDLHLLEPVQGYDPIMYPATKGRNKYSVDPAIADRMLFDSTAELEQFVQSHPMRTKPLAAFVREYKWVFGATQEEVAEQFKRLFCREGVTVWGHNGRIDFKLLLRLGVNLFDRVELDTITLALHLHESQPLGLEDISKRYLGAPNHKLELIHWLNTNKVVGGKLPYAFVPRTIIDPYACTDTRRTYDLKAELYSELEKLENQTIARREPSIKEAYFKYKMGQYNALAEMEVVGQSINLEALKTSIDWYDIQKKIQKKKCIDKVCAQTGWKEFNPESPAQIEKLLFDELKMQPLYSTDKPPVPWEKVMEMPIEEQAKYRPSTNQETLETLAPGNELCADLNNTRLLYTLGKSYLRKGARWCESKPTIETPLELWAAAEGKEIIEEEEPDDTDEDHWDAISKDKKSRALSQVVHPNGFLYSSYFELLETHRLATKPNISAIPKGEGKYIKDITGIAPPYEIRWLFESPDDWVYAEADWVTGEVWLLMMLAADPEGIKQVSDPSKFDIHSAMAKRMFPHIIPQDLTEIEVKKQFKKERDAAKPVTFGVPYQRGPEAIARQLNRAAANEGLEANYTKKDGEVFINAYKENFPLAWKYLDSQMKCVTNPKYQTSPWGFRRRYANIKDNKIINKLQREASNWQIQHGVACCMMMSCSVWSKLRGANPELPIFMVDILHDATKWLIHKSVLDIAPKIISMVMGDGLEFPKSLKPYTPLRHEISFYHQWGAKPIEDKEIFTMSGSTKPITREEIGKVIPTYDYLTRMIQ